MYLTDIQGQTMWSALDRTVVWRRWHSIDIALTQLCALSVPTEGSKASTVRDESRIAELLEYLNGWFERAYSMSPFGLRLLGQLPPEIKSRLSSRGTVYAERRAQNGATEMRLDQARALLAAFELANPGSDRSLWLIRQHLKPGSIPPSIMQKRQPAFEAFASAIETLSSGCRLRQAEPIVEAVSRLLELGQEDPPTLPPPWRAYWRSVEYEALNRLFIWPLLLLPGASGKSHIAVALPVSVSASETPAGLGPKVDIANGRSVLVQRREKRRLAHISGPADWYSVSNRALRYARDLVLNHHRHLDPSARDWIRRASMSIDLSAADTLAQAFDGRTVEACDASVGALLATSFGAALMRRPMPLIGITGRLVETADKRRGPDVRPVLGTGAKTNHVAMSGIYHLMVLPEGEPDDSEEQSASEGEWWVAKRHATKLADIYDIAFAGRWRRYQARRTAIRTEQQVESRHERVAEWFADAPVVAHLPEDISVDDITSYLWKQSARLALRKPAPPGIGQLVYAAAGEDRGGWGLLQLAECMDCELPKPIAMSQDPPTLSRGFADLLDARAGRYLNRPPDILVLIRNEQDDDLDSSLPTLDRIAEGASTLLQEPTRREAWSNRIGRVRVIIADPGGSHPSPAEEPAESLISAISWLSLFRYDFTEAQARSLLFKRLDASPPIGEVIAELRQRKWIVAAGSRGRLRVNVAVGPPSDMRDLALAHQQIATGYVPVIMESALSGMGEIGPENRWSVTEAAYHLGQAAALFHELGDHRERACGNMLGRLMSFGMPPNSRHIRLAAKLRIQPAEPFVAMALELKQAGQSWDSESLNALCMLLTERIKDFESRRREIVGMQEAELQLRVFASWLVDLTLGTFKDAQPAIAAAASLYNGGSYVVPAIKLAELREACLAAIRDEDISLESTNPNILHGLIFEGYDQPKDRHRHYKRALDGHPTYAGLFLAALGTSPSLEEAEAFIAARSPLLSAKARDYIMRLSWRRLPARLRREVETGYEYFAELS